MNMVELRAVAKRFGRVQVVQDLDLDIREGEFLTLLGPSGCGKTTVLRLISGFEAPSSGSVFLEGGDVTDVPPYRRNVNQVFQNYALFPHLSVWDNVCFGLKMKRVPRAERKERARLALEMMELTGMEKRRPSALSGGQRQRVALARAIVCRPKVLLLDEPLSALDAKLRQEMQVELKRLQQMLGITFVFVTHDQEEALAMSDRVVVMSRGRIEQIGSPAEVYHRPRTVFVAGFLGGSNIFKARVLGRTPQRVRVLVEEKTEWEIEAGDLPETAETIRIFIRPEKIHLEAARREGGNWVEVTVRENTFKGATQSLQLETDSGLKLSALAAHETALELSLRPGNRLACHLPPADILVLEG